MVSVLSEIPMLMLQAIDIFYKLSVIIVLFYATKALRIYIDKNQRS